MLMNSFLQLLNPSSSLAPRRRRRLPSRRLTGGWMDGCPTRAV